MGDPNSRFGTIVFASFSVITFVVFLAKGLVPIYFAECVLWAVVTVIWHKKSPTSQGATLVVMLLAVVVAAGEGYSVGQRVGSDQSSSPSGFVPTKSNNPYAEFGGTPISSVAPPTTDPCKTGIPAGVRTEPFTSEEIAGFNLIGADVRSPISGPGILTQNWLAVRFANSSTSGKCLTRAEFEIILGPEGKERTVHVTESDLQLAPGWGFTEGRGLEVVLPTHQDDPELISWKISKAWGYKVPGG